MKDFNLNIEIPDISIDIPIASNGFNNRYKRASVAAELKPYQVKYKNAQALASEIKPEAGMRYDCIVAGSFIFGDFIEAFLTTHNIKCKELLISTLSLDQNNIDSLANIMNGGFADSLDMIISDYFYSHERAFLIPYIYETLDKDNKFQLAVASSHCKIAMFETLGGRKIVIHGSANLRSSSSVEQFTIEDNAELYNFHYEYQKKIVEKYQTINKDTKKPKSIRNNQLWEVITQK